MSRHPFTWTPGQTVTLRASLYKKLELAAQVGEQIGIADPQVAALAAGQDVTFATAQLKSFYPRGTEHPSLPADLNAAEAWTLSGDNTMTAVES